MKHQAPLVSVFMIALCCMACEEALEQAQENHTMEQSIRNGAVINYQNGVFAAIGRVPGCSGTLLNSTTVLTAAHCFNVSWPATQRTTFTGVDGLTRNGTALVHPKWTRDIQRRGAFDIAVIKLDQPINESNFPNLSYPRVYGQFATLDNVVLIAGYGNVGSCTTSTSTLSFDWLFFDSFQQDSNYVIETSSEGMCSGDSGGPALMILNGQFHVVGIASTFQNGSWGTRLNSRYKPVYAASKWIMEKAADLAQPQLIDPTMGGRHCIGYNTTYHSTSIGMIADQNMLAVPSTIDNRISRVWVEKGYRLKGYDLYNFFGDQLIDVDGFTGENCNEKGCWHDLVGSVANNRISSMSCKSALPTNTWSDCIIYNTYGQSSFGTTHNSTALGSWSNRTKHAWVKRGHTLRLYPFTNYGTSSLYRINSITLNGTTALPGSMCNTHGCLHDLANEHVSKEGIASSLKCY